MGVEGKLFDDASYIVEVPGSPLDEAIEEINLYTTEPYERRFPDDDQRELVYITARFEELDIQFSIGRDYVVGRLATNTMEATKEC